MGDLFAGDKRAVSTAVFSDDRRHRFELWRRWDDGAFCMFVGLNPSTADEREDDPTVRRCVSFAQAWGYSALCMTNLFSMRATDPGVMKADAMPNLPANDDALLRLARRAGVVIAAWGAHGDHQRRAGLVVARMSTYRVPLYCLGKTKHGQPRHPLYLRKDLRPVPFNEAAHQVHRSRNGHNPAAAA